MKKSLRNVLLATFAATMAIPSYGASKIARFDDVATKFLIPTERQWKSAPSMQKPMQTPSISTHSVKLGPCQEYSFITGSDGEEWIAIQQMTESTTQKYYYTKSEISLYNSSGDLKGQFTAEVPEGASVNQINIGSVVTNRFFDTKSTTSELPVTFHIVHSPGVTSFVTYIYDIESGKTKEKIYDGYVEIVPYSTGYSTDYVAVVSRESTDDAGATLTCYDVYQKATYSAPDEATLKHTFEIKKTLAEYQIGNVLNVFTLGSELYYVVSQYEKEYMDPASYQPPYDMIPTEGNNYTATVYDRNFTAISTITIPVPVVDGYVTQFGIGLFDYHEFTKGFWSDDDKINIVVSRSTMEISSDTESIGFDVYNTDGELVKTIAEGVSDWFALYDIPGKSKQMVFLSADGTALSLVDVPSCETVTTLSYDVESYAISTSLDRYPVGDSYQYVIGLPEAQLIDDENYAVGYAWVTTAGEIEKIDWISVGSGFQNWTPLVMGEVLNPYLFDTDDMHEYMFILNQTVDEQSALLDQICVVEEEDTEIVRFKEDASGIGELGNTTIIGLDTNSPMLFMPFLNTANEITIQMEELPFTKFAGGDGSETAPYQIASAGDLAMVARDPDANYIVVNDIDMSQYGEWTSLPMFTGVLDGNNYTISNLYITDKDGNAALFSATEEAVIRNLGIESPEIELSSEAYEAGVLVANASSTTISNIHIYDATINGEEAEATIGGIVSGAYLSSTISECSVRDMTINAPKAQNVGGIAGMTGTSTLITACATSGSITAGSTIGGITGSSGTACAINYCHANIAIEGENKIGGIVGSDSRGGIYHCYVEGALTATATDTWVGHAVGGVVGYLEATFAETEKIITNNVVALSSLTAEGEAIQTSHRIVGYSRYDADLKDAQWDPNIVPEAEAGLKDNYVLASLDVIDTTIEATDATTEGASVDSESLNKAFFEGLGFSYGTDAANPWATDSDAAPYLYFEDANNSEIEDVIADKDNRIEAIGNTFTSAGAVVIEAYNVSGVKVGATMGDALTATDLATGMYVIVATYSDGSKASAKVVVK